MLVEDLMDQRAHWLDLKHIHVGEDVVSAHQLYTVPREDVLHPAPEGNVAGVDHWHLQP